MFWYVMLWWCICAVFMLCVSGYIYVPRKSHWQSGGDQGTPEGHRRTPGRTSDPLAVHIVPRLPRKSHRVWASDVCVSDVCVWVMCEWVMCVCVSDLCVSEWCVCVWVMCVCKWCAWCLCKSDVCVSDVCVSDVCVWIMCVWVMCVCVSDVRGGGGGGEGGRSGYRTKNKNPTRQCGE